MLRNALLLLATDVLIKMTVESVILFCFTSSFFVFIWLAMPCVRKFYKRQSTQPDLKISSNSLIVNQPFPNVTIFRQSSHCFSYKKSAKLINFCYLHYNFIKINNQLL